MRGSWRTASVGSGRASWEMFSMFDFIPEATQSQEKTLCSGLHFMRIRPADRWKADWRGGRVRQEAAWEAVASIRAERGRWGRGVREVDAVRLAEALADGVEEKEDTGHLLAF